MTDSLCKHYVEHLLEMQFLADLIPTVAANVKIMKNTVTTNCVRREYSQLPKRRIGPITQVEQLDAPLVKSARRIIIIYLHGCAA
jgi:hypothetical protein